MTQAQPPLVLLHGFTGCGAVWNDVKPHLVDTVICNSPDLPGHGSDEPPATADEFTFDGVCKFIERTLDHYGVERAALWGYSMGGRIALHFALRNPDRVQRLILESASPGIADEAERKRRRQSDYALADRLESIDIERFVNEWLDQPIFASQKSLPAERQALGSWLRLQNNAKGLAAALRGFSVGRQAPLHDRLKELNMPVLVIVGELDAKYREIGEAMVRSIPRAQFRIIAGAGHAPHWEQPSATAAAAIEFLNSPA